MLCLIYFGLDIHIFVFKKCLFYLWFFCHSTVVKRTFPFLYAWGHFLKILQNTILFSKDLTLIVTVLNLYLSVFVSCNLCLSVCLYVQP